MNDIISILLVLLVSAFLLYILINLIQLQQNNQQVELQSETTNTHIINNNNNKILVETDPVLEHDYASIYDPLIGPERRAPRHLFYPDHIYEQHLIGSPSRGYPDNFTQFGVLIKEKGKPGKGNRILRLFGRQEYPGSHKYEYYTAINSGLDQIKVPIDNNRKTELYDDDIVYIKELDSYYKVNLHKLNQPRYSPYYPF